MKLTLKKQQRPSEANTLNSCGSLSHYILVNERHFISTKLNWLRKHSLHIVVAILIALNVVVLTKHTDTANALQAARVQTIEEKNARQTVSKRFSELQEQKTTIDTSLREERLKAEKLEQENQSLKANLQAKKEREAEQARLASAQAPVQETVAQNKPAPAVQVTGDKHSWLAASGIPESEWQYVDFIVSRESGWNPNAVNPSSGACGLGQQLPCGKWPGAWNDPVAALKAQYGYVRARYGGYAGAYSFWLANRWY